MIVTFSIKQLMGDTPPTLWSRKGQAIFDSAKKDFGITNNGATSLDGNWSTLALDVRGSTRDAVLEYLTFLGAASVRLQPYDCDLFLANETDDVKALVQLNWSRLYSGQELEPDEIVTAFTQMVLAVMTHKPEQKAQFDPDSEYDLNGNFIGRREIRDAAFIEMEEARQAQEREASRAANQRDADGFYAE